MPEHQEGTAMHRRTPSPDTRKRRLILGSAVMTTVVSAAIAVATFDASAAVAPPSTAPSGPVAPIPSGPVTAAPSGPVTPAPSGPPGAGDVPLTAAEMAKARSIAVTPELTESAKDVTGAKGPEFLAAKIVVGGASRVAAVYLYDYAANELIKQIVDITAGKLTGSFQAAQGTQLPASDKEIATALDLVLASPVGAELKKLYTTVSDKPWTGPNQIKADANIYFAAPDNSDDSDDSDDSTSKCGEDRCLRLVAQVADGPFIELDDITVNLSQREVVQLR